MNRNLWVKITLFGLLSSLIEREWSEEHFILGIMIFKKEFLSKIFENHSKQKTFLLKEERKKSLLNLQFTPC